MADKERGDCELRMLRQARPAVAALSDGSGTGVIKLTRRNGNAFVLNAELIKFVEEVPDTIVTLRDGEKILVAETADRVVDLSLQYARLTRYLPEA